MRTLRAFSMLLLSIVLVGACATTGPKRTVTVDTLGGTSWAGEWGSDGAHGMRSQVQLTLDQADLGAVQGTLGLTNQGRHASSAAKGLIETRDGATWIRLTSEGGQSFDLRFTGSGLEGRGTSAIHQGPVSLALQ